MKVLQNARTRSRLIISALSVAVVVWILTSLATPAQQAPPRGGAAPAAAGRGGRGGGAQGTPVLGPNNEVWGFSDTAFNPNSRWRIHDAERPQPPSITPGETVSIPAPSDAVILFNGKDLSQWVNRGANGAESPATWTVRDGYFEAQGGNLLSLIHISEPTRLLSI